MSAGKISTLLKSSFLDNCSKLTPAIRITNVMPVSTSHSILDGFTAQVWHQIYNKVENEKELWKHPKKDEKMTLLMPALSGPSGMSIVQ